MAYYVSFLKILSLKLNKNTIHFFFNEVIQPQPSSLTTHVSLFQHLSNFPLYTSAIRFYNHKESMVRIAVRTLTLNVYRGERF